MQLSTRGRYAVSALIELAGRPEGATGQCVTLAQIATGRQLSLCYLEQLFARLRRAGLVHASRGPGGGYRLAKPANEITIAAVLDAVEVPSPCTDPESSLCASQALWRELGRQMHLFLAAVTLDDVTQDRVAGRALAPRRVDRAA